MDEEDLARWSAAGSGDLGARARIADALSVYLAGLVRTLPLALTDPPRTCLLAEVLLQVLRKIDRQKAVEDPKGVAARILDLLLLNWREQEQPAGPSAHPASFDPEPSVPIEHAPAESELRERFQRLARTEDLIAQLICLLLQNGASSELVELYDSVQSSLRRWVMSLGVPRVEAGRIARDVISELYAHWRDLKNPEKAGGYARTILFRLVRKLQAERRRARRRAGLSEDIPGPRGTVAVEESLEAEDSFWHIIRTLGPPARVIFILRYAGSGNREIADCLGLSLRTVERLVAQIRQRAGPLVDPQR